MVKAPDSVGKRFCEVPYMPLTSGVGFAESLTEASVAQASRLGTLFQGALKY